MDVRRLLRLGCWHTTQTCFFLSIINRHHKLTARPVPGLHLLTASCDPEGLFAEAWPRYGGGMVGGWDEKAAESATSAATEA